MVEVKTEGAEVPANAPADPQSPAVEVKPTPEVKVEDKSGDPSTPADANKQVPLPALQEERSKRQASESRADQLAAEVADLRARINTPTQVAPQPQQQAPSQDLEKLWEDDPRKAVQVEIMTAMDWRDKMDSSLEVQADQLASKFPDFNNYRSTAMGQVRSLPISQRGGAGILEAAYFMVRGQNADSLLQARETELLEKYRRGEIDAAGLATPPGSFSAPASPEGVTISSEQAQAAEAMGLTPEQYASQIVGGAQ